MPISKKSRIFYGYWIVAVAFFCLFIFSGCAYYAFSLFVRPIETQFGWGRGNIMLAFTIFVVFLGVSAPFIGRLTDRYGINRVIATGAFIAGLGFILVSLTRNLWYFYGGYIAVGIGSAGIGQVPTATVVSNWFSKRRGTAIGIMATGIGAGGFAIAPIVGGYLIPNFGWRVSYVALALLTWTLIPLSLLVIRTKPADMGLYPDGAEVPQTVAEAKTSLSAPRGLSLKTALATSAFWLIAVSFLTSAFGHVGIIQSQVPYLDGIGFPVAAAAAALGTVGLGSLIGKFGFGWLCDRINAKYACCIGLVFQLVAIILLMNVGEASPPAIIWLYATTMGLGVGSWLPTMSILTSANFGMASHGAIFGMITLAHSLGTAAGPLVAGYTYDIMNTYHWAFIISLALYAISIPAILAVRRPISLE